MLAARLPIFPLVLLLLAACSSGATGDGASGGSATGGHGGAGGGGETQGGGGNSSGGSGNGPPGQGGAPDPCQAGCDRIESCGVSGVCGNTIQCGDVSDCVFTCFATSDCGAIDSIFKGGAPPQLAACLGQCDGGATCFDCALPSLSDAAQCASPASACGADPECSAWVSCTSQCATPSCFEQCDEDHSAATALFDPLYACMCQYCGPLCPLVINSCK